jgi:hypothetical protein
MESNIYIDKRRSGWKIVGVIFIVITIIALAAGVFLALKYMDDKNQITDQQNKISQLSGEVEGLKTKLAEAEAQKTTDTSGVSLAIKEWDIKITLPDSIVDVQYAIDSNNVYFIARPASGNVKYAPGVLDDVKGYALATLTRSTSNTIGGLATGQAGIKIGDYYYFVSGAQGILEIYGTTDADYKAEATVRDALVKALETVSQ